MRKYHYWTKRFLKCLIWCDKHSPPGGGFTKPSCHTKNMELGREITENMKGAENTAKFVNVNTNILLTDLHMRTFNQRILIARGF